MQWLPATGAKGLKVLWEVTSRVNKPPAWVWKWPLPSLNTPPQWLCADIFCRQSRLSGWFPPWARKRLRRTSCLGDAADDNETNGGARMYILITGAVVCTLAFTSAMGSMLLFSGRPAATGAKLCSWLWFVATKLKPRNSWWVLALGGMPGESGQATTHRQKRMILHGDFQTRSGCDYYRVIIIVVWNYLSVFWRWTQGQSEKCPPVARLSAWTEASFPSCTASTERIGCQQCELSVMECELQLKSGVLQVGAVKMTLFDIKYFKRLGNQNEKQTNIFFICMMVHGCYGITLFI